MPGLDLREVEDVVDQPEQVLAGRVDPLEVGDEALGVLVLGLLLEHLAVADDGVERRPELVGHVGQELGLVLARDLELPALRLELPEEPRVLDRQRGLPGEGLEEVHDLVREQSDRLPPHRQHAQDPLLRHERHRQDRAVAELEEDRPEPGRAVCSLVADVRQLDGLPAERRLARSRPRRAGCGAARSTSTSSSGIRWLAWSWNSWVVSSYS